MTRSCLVLINAFSAGLNLGVFVYSHDLVSVLLCVVNVSVALAICGGMFIHHGMGDE